MLTIHSGGAEGSDACFGNVGTELGYEVIHHSFKGHRVNGLGKEQKHNLFQLYLANAHLKKANQSLCRFFPPKSDYVKRLLQRNLYQVKDSGHIVAIAKLEKNLRTVKGGTGWAVAMGIDMAKDIFVFDDGQSNAWYYYNYTEGTFIRMDSLPMLEKDFAGVGTRDITQAGIHAITDLLKANSQKETKLKFWTAQYRYSGEDRFDVTVKGAVNFAFAPTWEMVNAIKNGTMTEEEYTARYEAMMEKSIGKNKKAWQDLLSQEEATIVCFCPTDQFCHRYILADILKRLGARYMGERQLVSKKLLKA